MKLSLFNPKKGILIYTTIENNFLIESIKSAKLENDNEDLIDLFVLYFKSNIKNVSNLPKIELNKSPFDTELGIIIENICCFYFEDYINRIDNNYLKELSFDTLILERILKEKHNEKLDLEKVKVFKKTLYNKKNEIKNRLFEYVVINSLPQLNWKNLFNIETDKLEFEKFINDINWLKSHLFSIYDKIVETIKTYHKEFKKVGIDFNGIANYNGFYHQRKFQMDFVSTNFDLILDIKNYSSSSISKTENVKQLFWNYHILLNIK